MRRALAVVAVWGAILGGGCGGGASTTQPASPTARAAEVDPRVVVVWSAEQQADLLQATQQGPVLLRVEGQRATVLKQCALGSALIHADYTYVPASVLATHVALQDRAATRSRLPEMADSLFVMFGPELARGDAIDVALTSVGKLTLGGAPTAVRHNEIDGADECASATHLVTGATVGAFDIATTAAKSGGPTRQIKSGNLALCGDARAAQCSSPLMLELLAISP